MLTLKHNHRNILEPNADNRSFLKRLKKTVEIKINPKIYPKNTLYINFFNYPLKNQFNTIINNPPYIKHKNITPNTKKKLNYNLFNKKNNLYLFFIKKTIKHLKPKNKLIFITPKNFLKSTSNIKLNK